MAVTLGRGRAHVPPSARSGDEGHLGPQHRIASCGLDVEAIRLSCRVVSTRCCTTCAASVATQG